MEYINILSDKEMEKISIILKLKSVQKLYVVDVRVSNIELKQRD
jgi:hypothetical protein